MPTHAGGGRQADYCSRSCQAKAYRKRHAHGTARDDSQWSALTARAAAAETEAAALRKQLAAAQRRIDKLTAELAAPRTTEGTAGARQEPAAAAPSTPALPPPINVKSGARRYEQTGTSAWAVYVDDVPIGDIKCLSGKYFPTLPNGFEVYLGNTADNLDEATDKLTRAYNGWSNYWHDETAARLTLLRPQLDGARTVKWRGGTRLGKVSPAAAIGGGAEGFVAIRDADGALSVRGRGPTVFADEKQAADALLKRYQAEHAPPWGDLVR